MRAELRELKLPADKDKDKAKKDLYEQTLAAFELAAKAFRRDDCQKASELFEGFIEKYPGERELVDRARIYLAICRDKGKKDTIPLKEFEDFYELGVYRMNQGEFDEALKLFQKAQDKEPDSGKILYLIGKVHLKLGQPEKFFENLKSAVQKDKFVGVLAQNDPELEDVKDEKKFKIITKFA